MQKPATNIGKAIAELNESYESTLLKHAQSTEAVDECEIDFSDSFFGFEWGVSEWNVQRQKWRWLGPFGQSHLFLKLTTDTDHLVRVYIHTAASGQTLDALTAYVNGAHCAQQGHDWGADGIPTHWCIVNRQQIRKSNGIAKMTWSILSPEQSQERPDPQDEGKPLALARSIAFSRVTCEPYPAKQASVKTAAVHVAITEPYSLEPPAEQATRHVPIINKLRRLLNLG